MRILSILFVIFVIVFFGGRAIAIQRPKPVVPQNVSITIAEDGSGSIQTETSFPQSYFGNCKGFGFKPSYPSDWKAKATTRDTGTHCVGLLSMKFTNIEMLNKQLAALSQDYKLSGQGKIEGNTISLKITGASISSPTIFKLKIIVTMPEISSVKPSGIAIQNGNQVSWDCSNSGTTVEVISKIEAIDVSFRAFIPCDAVMAIPPKSIGPRYLFKGDGYSGETSRAMQIAQVKFDSKKGPLLLGKSGYWEASSYYKNSQGKPVINDRHWCWKLLPGQKEKYVERKKLEATPQNNNVSFVKLTPTSLKITFVLDGGNPVAPTWDFLTPNLSAKLSVFLRKEKGEKLQYLISGSHDGFPAYQIYINGQLVYCYDPLASGEDPYALGAPKDRRVDTSDWQYFPATSAPIQFRFCKR